MEQQLQRLKWYFKLEYYSKSKERILRQSFKKLYPWGIFLKKGYGYLNLTQSQHHKNKVTRQYYMIYKQIYSTMNDYFCQKQNNTKSGQVSVSEFCFIENPTHRGTTVNILKWEKNDPVS